MPAPLTKKRKAQDSGQQSEQPNVAGDESDDNEDDGDVIVVETEAETRARLQGEAQRAAKLYKKSELVWNTLNKIWPLEDRPDELQDRDQVALLDLEDIKHLREMHKLENNEKGDKKDNLVRDKKPKEMKFREGPDNCFNLLHPGRWMRMPLAPHAEWFHKTPTKRNEVYISMEMDFTGSNNVIADRTIIDMHDRKNQLSLKMFLSENVSVANKPKVETRTQEGDGTTSTSYDLNWRKPSTLSAVQEAYHNYSSLSHWLWPFDPTPISLLRLMHKFKWLEVAENQSNDSKLRVELVKTFFNQIMKKLAAAALNNKCVPSFKEMEDLLKSTLSQNGLSTEVPANTKFQQGRQNYNNHFNKQSPNSNGGRGKFNNSRGNARQARGYNNQPKNPGAEPKLWANVNGKGLCYAWNSTDGRSCNHKRVDVGKYKGCEDDLERKFVHLCSEWVHSKEDYCYGNHPRKQHR